MAKPEQSTMHPDFADWYRKVTLACDSTLLQHRWNGLDAFVNDASHEEVIELARLFFGLPPRDNSFISSLRKRFKEADEAFPMRDNDAELRVLAGAALVKLLDYDDKWSTLSALTLICGASWALREAPVQDIVAKARTQITTSTQSRRQRHALIVPQAKTQQEKLGEVRNAFQANQLPNAGTALDAVLTGVSASLDGLTSWADALTRQVQIWDEESNVLWWLYGGHSRDLNKPFAELETGFAILVAAKELADLVHVLPGPPSALAFLDRTIRPGREDVKEKLSVASVVAACPLEWQERFLAQPEIKNILDLCPVHTAVAKSVEVKGNKSWQAAYESLTALNSRTKIAPLDVSLQAFHERLLIKAITDLASE